MIRKHRFGKWWLISEIIAFPLILVALVFCQRLLLYHPDKSVPDPARWSLPRAEVVHYRTEDGLTLFGWYLPPPEGRPVAVIFHGNAGHIGHRNLLACISLGMRMGVLLVEYRGYGGNPGRPTEKGLYADGRAALDWLAGRGIGGERVILIGESLGTGVAVQMASERKIAGMALLSPFDTMTDVAVEKFPWLPVRWLFFDRFESIERIGQIDAPLLIIHGTSDKVVPIDHGRRLFALAAEPKRMVEIPDTGHNDLLTNGRVTKALQGWLDNLPY